MSILVLTLLATFFLGALVQMNPGRLRRNLHDQNRDRAALAAKAGVDYALNRFKSDTHWTADANQKTVDMEDLVIREDNGNVLGWIRADDGSWTGFRMRFNAQDGPLGRDGWDDPQYPISSRSLSLNNLAGSNDKPVPRANSSYSAPVGSTDTTMTAPPNSIALLVEGIVAPDLDPSNPANLAEATGVTTRTVEGIFVVSDIIAGTDGDAVLMARGDATIEVGDKPRADEIESPRDVRGVLSLQSSSDNVAGIRTKQKLEITRGQGGSTSSKFDPDEDATVHVNPQTPFTETLADGTTFEGGEEDADAAFQKIEWDKVKNSEQSDAVSLPGGVYIFTDGNADSGRSLSGNVKFFDMTWDQYRQTLLNGGTPQESPVPQDFLSMVELDAKEVTLTKVVNGEVVEYQEKRDVINVTGDVTVNDPDGKGLTIVPERGARQKAGSDETPSVDPSEWTPAEGNSNAAQVMEQLSQMGGWSSGTGGFAGHMTFSDGSTVNLIINSGGQATYVPSNGGVLFWQQAQAGNPITFNGASGTVYPAVPGADFAPVGGKSVLQVNDLAEFSTHFLGAEILGAGGGASDPLHIPKLDPDTGLPISDDETVPQDIEMVFDPAEGKDSAFIRSETDIFLGTHLSGEGGGVISNRNVNLVGFGVNLDAKVQANEDERQERTGVAIYGKEGINISTYDERRNKYWDVEVKGAVFTEGDISINLGEEPLTNGENPTWGVFDYEGSMIALGDGTPATGVDITNPGTIFDGDGDGESDGEGGGEGEPRVYSGGSSGKADIVARGVRLFYDPRYLAPYVEETTINPTFTALSVVER